jgi:acetoin:2,6-dichlorophenolindophenol oxidoreductase subunit alpha
VRRTRDCLEGFAGRVTAAGVVAPEDLRRVDDEVQALIDDAVEQAKAAPEPEPSDLLTDVYVKY